MKARGLKITAALALAALSVFFLLRRVAPAEPLPPAGGDGYHTATAVNAFGLDLLGKVATRPGNLCFSPYSIHSALATTHAGAARQTADQLAAALHLDATALAGERGLNRRLQAPGNHGFELATANRLWLQRGAAVLPAFTAQLADDFHADLQPVDFADPATTVATINQWTSQRTRGRIPVALGPTDLPSAAALILTNALYFKGSWSLPFKESETAEGDFFAPAGKVRAMMMTQRKEHDFAYFEAAGEVPSFRALSLDYRGGDLAMLFLLPEIGQIDALASHLNEPLLTTILQHLREAWLPITLPRFKMTDSLVLPAPLKELGVKDAFDPLLADFSKLSPKPLFLSAVLHKTFIEVNEEGTEAAAVTGSSMAAAAAIQVAPEFKADHPFLFLIRDKETGAILFLGRLTTP